MDNNKLSLDDYSVEILDTDNDEIRILPSKDHDITLPTYAPNQLSDHQASCRFKTTLPVFFKQGIKYRLIANQWVYDYIVNHPNIKKFLAIVIANKKYADEIKDLEVIQTGWLSGSSAAAPRSGEKKKRKPSDTRTKANKSGRLCPFCKGKLNKEIKSRKIKKEHIKKNSIVCENKNSTWTLCKFTDQLTDAGMAKFNNFQLRTVTSYLVRLKGKQCKHCKDDLYLRIAHLPNNGKKEETVCRKCLINDSPFYSHYEFKTQQAAKDGQSVKELCQAIVDADLNIDLPKKPFGLLWLKKFLSSPGIYNRLLEKGHTIPKQAKPFIKKMESDTSLFPDDPDINAQQENLYKLNRMLIENIFPQSPKLYLKDGSICKDRRTAK